MRLHLGGHLSWYDPARRSTFDVDLCALGLPARVPLADLLARLGLPAGEVAIVVINGRPAPPGEAVAGEDDRVELYPPIGGG